MPDLGTLNNYDDVNDTWDAYLKTSTDFLDEELTVDLFQLVLQDSSDTVVNVRLSTATGPDHQTITDYNLSTSIHSPMDGDLDRDGDIDAVDFDLFGAAWFRGEITELPLPRVLTWENGDFDADVDAVDFEAFGTGWFSHRGPFGGGEDLAPVPEPSTIALLVAGALCLAGGYRLRG